MKPTASSCLGKSEDHLTRLPSSHLIHQEVADPFTRLVLAAKAEGFSLTIASAFRGFSRQLAIWNAKASGARGVHDSSGKPIQLVTLSPVEKIHAILRFSALPGTSRHHWGTDLDVYDASAVAPDYSLQLVPAEFEEGGPFAPLHDWLDENLEAHGFFRPYDIDRGGVSPERWHISHAEVSEQFRKVHSLDILRDGLASENLELKSDVFALLPELYRRYVASCSLP